MRVSRSKERDIRNALRREIQKKGLIDTGLLYDSIEVKVNIDEFGVMEIDVDSVDYIKYLWIPYKLDKFIYEGNIISRCYAEWVDYKTKQNPMLDWGRVSAKIVFNIPD